MLPVVGFSISFGAALLVALGLPLQALVVTTVGLNWGLLYICASLDELKRGA